MQTTFDLARSGDRAATCLIVERLRPRLARLAAYYARHTGEDADDLLQDAWLSLLTALPKLDLSIGSPEQYLIQRARWGLLDSVRRSRVRRCDSLDEDALPAKCHPTLLSDDQILLHEFLARLNPAQQNIVHCLLSGMTWRETGRALGFTSANVAYHVRKIRQRYETWNERGV